MTNPKTKENKMHEEFIQKVINQDQLDKINEIRQCADKLMDVLDTMNTRYSAIAKTNLEQTVMWCNKAISYEI
jgi:hypothetical protein